MTVKLYNDHIAETKYRRGSVANLLSYIGRDENVLKNRAGLEMDNQDIQHLIDRSEKHQFERHYIISPKNWMTDRELEEATRDSINQYFDGPTVDFAYSVHRDEKGPHAHVALVGSEDDLEAYPPELEEFNDLSEEIYDEKAQTFGFEEKLMEENDLYLTREEVLEEEEEEEENENEYER